MDNHIECLKKELLNSRMRNEQAEVILSNLLLLKSEKDESFIVPFDDVVITIQSTIDLLKYSLQS